MFIGICRYKFSGGGERWSTCAGSPRKQLKLVGLHSQRSLAMPCLLSSKTEAI